MELVRERSMAGHGSAKCDFSNVISGVDNQMYTFAGLKTDEEGILKLVFDPSADNIKVKLDGQDTEFPACTNGECPSKTPVPAGTYTVMVENIFRGDDGTIPAGFDRWTTLPLIKTYHVGDKNYCEGKI